MSTLLWEASRTFRSCCRVSGVYEVPDCVNHRKETGMLAGPRCVRIFNSMDNKTNLPCHCSPLPLLLGIPLPLLSLATALPCHYSRPIFHLPLLYLATALPCHYSTLPLLSLATTPGYSLATALPCHCSPLPLLLGIPLPLLSLATTPVPFFCLSFSLPCHCSPLPLLLGIPEGLTRAILVSG